MFDSIDLNIETNLVDQLIYVTVQSMRYCFFLAVPQRMLLVHISAA